MRRAVPWFDLAIGIGASGAGLMLLATGIDRLGPLSFLGWRSLLLAIPGVLLARPSATAWRDALPAAAALVLALGMLGNALAGGDVATVAVVAIGIALGIGPLVHAAACPRLPTLAEGLGGALVVAGIAVLGIVDGAGPEVWLAGAAGIGFAGVVVLTERVIHDHPAPAIVMPQVLVAGAVLVGAGALLGETWLPGTDLFPLLAVTGLGTGLAAMLARWRGAEVLGPRAARLALPAEILVAVAVAIWAGGRAPDPALWAALGLVVAGTVVVAWHPGPLAETELFSAGR
ncbi:MAG: hypothetical protein AB1Z57_01950 [Acidimicrobiia bacterium]